jgi:hypothetical protein
MKRNYRMTPTVNERSDPTIIRAVPVQFVGAFLEKWGQSNFFVTINQASSSRHKKLL